MSDINRYRVAYTLIFIISAIMAVFSNTVVYIGLCAGFIIYPIFFYVYLIIKRRNVNFTFDIDIERDKIELKCEKDLGYWAIVESRNCFMNMKATYDIYDFDVFFNTESLNCGKNIYTIKDIFLKDPIGIIKVRIKDEKYPNDYEYIKYPVKKEIAIDIDEYEHISDESSEYSMIKAGHDNSEIYAIREYMPGDSLKQIHFKKSQKEEKLYVKEYAAPIVKKTVIVIENIIHPDFKEKCDMDILSDFAGKVLYVTEYLLELGVEISCVFSGEDEDDIIISQIHDYKDKDIFFELFLSSAVKYYEIPVSESEIFLNCNYRDFQIINPDIN